MGQSKKDKLRPFTLNDVKNKELVIKMLNYEEQLSKSSFGQSHYKNKLNRPLTSLTIERALQRFVLAEFGFTTKDEDVVIYRTIFKNYYKSPDDYDKDVLNATHYMRENKCVYYKSPILEIGQIIPDCNIYKLNGTDITSIYDIVNNKKASYTILAAFSLS